jgi:D-sedoheptulose 7-phosphate isomerase
VETRDFVGAFLAEIADIAARTNRDDVARVVELLWAVRAEGRHVYTCGNGGSASTASHLACDLALWASAGSARPFRAASLCDNPPLLSALTNDLGFGRVFVAQLEGRMQPGDALVCLSVHGGAGADRAGPWSQNLVAAARHARAIGGRVIAFVGYDGGPLRDLADASVVVPRTAAGATSTPHVEAMHVVYHHLVCERLRQLVEERG